MKNNFIIILISVLICLAGTALAQFGSIGSVDARSMGMGKTYTAVTTGVYSIGLNPANLVFNNDAKVEFSTLLPLPTVSMRGGTDFMSLKEFNFYFGGDNGQNRVLNDTEKNQLYNLFEGGGSFFANAGAYLLSFGVTPSQKSGSFAFTIADYSGGKAFVPEAFADFALNGNPQGKVFDISQSRFSSWWIRQYALSYARIFPEFSKDVFQRVAIGMSVKLIHGFAYVGSEEVTTYLTTSDKNIITGDAGLLAYSSFSNNFGVEYEFDSENKPSNFSPFPSPAGTGLGVDVGFTAAINERWNIALAFTDIGAINWTDNSAKFASDGPILLNDVTNKAQRDSVFDLLTGTAEPVEDFRTSLATALRFGASVIVSDYNELSFPGKLMLAFDYNQGFNEMPGNTTTPRFSVGAEWKPVDFVPYIRTGFEVLGVDGFNWAFGLGFDVKVLEIHLATSSMQTVLFPFPSNKISFSVSSRWKF